jgi:CheY-like chemotaxis protein/HPt (histidine-containing phosphotransfer) domain-containing protein
MLAGARVLVVDGSATNRRVVCGQLDSGGVQAAGAAGVDDALATLEAASVAGKPVHIVIVDEELLEGSGATLRRRIASMENVMQPQLIVLTSLEKANNAQRLGNLGFSGYLIKPVRSSELWICLAKLLEQQRSGPKESVESPVKGDSDTGNVRPDVYQGTVLVVEDHPVNQLVARRFLERLGCEVVVVEDGKRAVALCTQREFALVLMDVQMPVMDGLTATREIRKREGGGRRTPIIALTASVMTGEVERCLNAGMDGVLTKPLEPSRLRTVVAQYLQTARTVPAPKNQTPATGAESSPVDLDRLRELVGQDDSFLREFCATFIDSSAQTVAAIEAALAADDRVAISALAHKLKGASGTVYAIQLVALASRLEIEAAASDRVDLEARVRELRPILEECVRHLERSYECTTPS